MLDEQLAALLKAFLLDIEESRRLFRSEGSLGTFSVRIDVSRAAGLISAEEASDLHTIRRIRNDFAHKLHGLSFANDSIIDRCRNIATVTAIVNAGKLPSFNRNEARQVFNVAVAVLVVYLIRRIDRIVRCSDTKSAIHDPLVSLMKSSATPSV